MRSSTYSKLTTLNAENRLRLFTPLVVLSLCIFTAPLALGAQDDGAAWMRMDRSSLTVTVDLASETPADTVTQRDQALDRLYEQIERAGAERLSAAEVFNAVADSNFSALIAAQAERPIDYLLALRRSFSGYRGAEAADDHEWKAKNLTAARKYAALAAAGLTTQAKVDEQSAANLQGMPFAVRRSPDEAQAFADGLKRNGLSETHRKLLAQSGLNVPKIDAYQKKIAATPRGEIGMSMVELYQQIAKARRELAASLEQFATARTLASEPMSQRYLVGNPHDRAETIDLFIRRASVPPEWKLSVVDAETTPDGKPQHRVQEVEAGRHYRVQLPAQGQLTVASVVVPVGVLAEKTKARWAVEGKIGDELIGGMMHELKVPGFIADLTLPPITPDVVTRAPSPPATAAQARWMMPAVIAAAALLVLATVLVFFLRSRRKGVPRP